MTTEDTSPRVSYGVKELLGRIDFKLESIDSKLDAKADLRELQVIEKRVEAQGERITDLSNRFTNAEALRADREKQAGMSFSKKEKLAALIIAAAAVLLQYLPHLHFHG